MNFPVYVSVKTRDVPVSASYVHTVVKITQADLDEHLGPHPPALNPDQIRQEIRVRAGNLSGTALSDKHPLHRTAEEISEAFANGLTSGQKPIYIHPTESQVWLVPSNP